MVARPTAAAPALDPGARYTKLAVTLHWLIAALVVAQLGLGWWMLDIPKQPGGVRAFWFNVHKSVGMTIALLVLVRIAWRLRHPAPLLPARVPAWQRRSARTRIYGLTASPARRSKRSAPHASCSLMS